MSLNVQNANYYKQSAFYGIKNNKREDAGFKPHLNPKKSIALTFGWSKSVQPGSVEEKILDVLTDPKIKSAVVATHTKSDGDAYGSNLGIAGILNNMGVKVFSTVDDFPQKQFMKMPSIEPGVPATTFITRPDQVKSNMIKAGIQDIDLAVITDCPVPSFTQGFKNKENNVLNLVFDAKKFVIIDHHPDTEGQPTNEEQWVKALTDLGAKKENILYWREIRCSAAEMVGQLDREVDSEAKKGELPNYKVAYPGYRLAIAGGMYTDSGAVDNNKGQVKFARLTDRKVQADNGSFVSITRNIFDWLINNCGVPKAKVNFNEIASLPLPKEFKGKLRQIVSGKLQIEGITVKTPTSRDPLGFIFIENWDGLDKLTDEVNRQNRAEGKIRKEDKIYSSDIYKELKEIAQGLHRDKNLGVFLLVSKIKEKNTDNASLNMSVRSYGFNSLQGEIHEDGHVFVDKGAHQVIDAIKAKGIGDGGGHANAGGVRINTNLDFYKDVLPVITEAVKNSNPTRKVPDDYKAEIVNFTGSKNKNISLLG